MTSEKSRNYGLWRRLSLWARRVRLRRKAETALIVAALLSGIATYVVLSGQPGVDESDYLTVRGLFTLDTVLLLLLSVMIILRIVHLWVERRRGGGGSKLHVRLVLLFSFVSVTPAILVAVFSVIFIDVGMQSWFNERVRTALTSSVVVAEAYVQEHQQNIAGDVMSMTNAINRSFGILGNRNALERFLQGQSEVRGLSEAVIFGPTGNVLVSSGMTFSLSVEQVPLWALDKANSGEVAVMTSETDELVRALAKIDEISGLYLYVGRLVDPTVISYVDQTKSAVLQYEAMEKGRSELSLTFSLIFTVVAVLLLLAAVWVGLVIATRLARPIMELIDAAEKVRGGDLEVRVSETTATDEMGTLGRAFNRMTDQISTQQDELLQANRELDERSRFTETVLAGVSAGVIGLDPKGNINLPNRSASILLQTDLDQALGKSLVKVVPELKEMMAAVRKRRDRLTQGEIKIIRDGQHRVFQVRLAPEQLHKKVIGYVVTFDDITELQSAQRLSAWADVARRIAHEIKNPLTPIQLSAERLKRKYLKEVSSDPDVFTACTDTIVRQVGDIRKMVDEFSEFARMPAPVKESSNLGDLIDRAIFMQRTATPEIIIEFTPPKAAVHRHCDPSQLGQVLTNVLKNAAEAIEGRDKQSPKGLISVCLEGDERTAKVVVIDNGRGLPKEERDRLTEPYVTTRSKGTGLGLAIVKKIMEDHGGALILDDAETGGARVSMVFEDLETGSADQAESESA